MKKITLLTIVASMLCLLLSSCGASKTVGVNHATSLTNVQLSQNNFKVVDRVTGKASNTYILVFGGFRIKNLYERAKNDMLEKADLIDKAKAVIDITYDVHVRSVLCIYSTYTITASGTVIEFSNP
jgi:hypothetical protein